MEILRREKAEQLAELKAKRAAEKEAEEEERKRNAANKSILNQSSMNRDISGVMRKTTQGGDDATSVYGGGNSVKGGSPAKTEKSAGKASPGKDSISSPVRPMSAIAGGMMS